MANDYRQIDTWKTETVMYLIAQDLLSEVQDDDIFKHYLEWTPPYKTNILYEIPPEINALLHYIYWYNNDRKFWEAYYHPQTQETPTNETSKDSIIDYYNRSSGRYQQYQRILRGEGFTFSPTRQRD